jgi:protein-S-isoprenylcysteine O-methyltransferase Ste14
MAILALSLWLLFGLLALGLRVALQVRRTGESGLRGLSGNFGSLEWLAGVGLVVAIAAGVAAPLVDALEPVEALDVTTVHLAGLVLYGAGLAIVVVAQHAMGPSWRAGVDPSERTALVSRGPFQVVRNPIFTGMIAVQLGIALLVPSVVALASAALLLLALEIHTRKVEEPYLLRAHGAGYADYAARVGRFLPGVGRLTRG